MEKKEIIQEIMQESFLKLKDITFLTKRVYLEPSIINKNRSQRTHHNEILDYSVIKMAGLTQQQHQKLESNESMFSKV